MASNESVSIKLGELIQQMDKDKIEALTQVLYHHDDESLAPFNTRLKQVYSNSYGLDREAYLDFLSGHQIEYLGGGNSKNFLVSDSDNNVCVLRTEFPLNIPRKKIKPMQRALSEPLAKTYARRETTDPEGEKVFIAVCEYCPGGNIIEFGRNLSDKQRMEQAPLIFSQMATTLTSLRNEGLAHPDSKNQNWLVILNNNNMPQLKVIDTKAIVRTRKGMINEAWLDHKKFFMIKSKEYYPPELKLRRGKRKANADGVHAYILGKNLYQFITNCDGLVTELENDCENIEEAIRNLDRGNTRQIEQLEREYDQIDQRAEDIFAIMEKPFFDEEDFSTQVFPVFAAYPGTEYKTIIQQLMHEDPSQRLSVTDALQQLKNIHQQLTAQQQSTNQPENSPVAASSTSKIMGDLTNSTPPQQAPDAASSYTTATRSTGTPGEGSTQKEMKQMMQLGRDIEKQGEEVNPNMAKR